MHHLSRILAVMAVRAVSRPGSGRPGLLSAPRRRPVPRPRSRPGPRESVRGGGTRARTECCDVNGLFGARYRGNGEIGGRRGGWRFTVSARWRSFSTRRASPGRPTPRARCLVADRAPREGLLARPPRIFPRLPPYDHARRPALAARVRWSRALRSGRVISASAGQLPRLSAVRGPAGRTHLHEHDCRTLSCSASPSSCRVHRSRTVL